ncbi:cytochrome b5 [Danaus plexippus plexippus]|uniref:Cytochrome b5 n=1 Tax=Danaus plexippus plexippus TaxID=278856 RepID=A0A212FAP8_DANPL|nr:cytochrome b5 [Danaus plexippus plexippus]
MTRYFTREEVSRRNHRQDAAIIIDNVVYDVTDFLEHHPGGIEVLLDNAGKDASKCFADVGHSEDAKLWRAQYKVGEVVADERWQVVAPVSSEQGEDSAEYTLKGLLDVLLPPLFMGAVALVTYNYLLS